MAPSPLARLPHALVHSIFSFALVPARQRGLGAPRGGAPAELQTLAAVSREWNEYANNVASALTLRELSLPDLKIKTRKELLELRRRITLRRGFLRTLKLSYENQHASDRGNVLSLAHWRAILSHAPLLEEMDLKWMVRDDAARIASIVRAAKLLCPRLSSLVLPSLRTLRSGHASESPVHTQLLMDAVLEEGCGTQGLRTLRFPIDFMSAPRQQEQATAYLNKICDVCPQLETLDGYVPLVDNNEQLSCDELWYIDVATWERFCRSCDRLKSFDWIVAPFATTFFEIFGRHPKPRLERLVFSTAMNWDWDEYHLAYSSSRPTSGFGATARNAHAALKACPSLRDLEVAVYLPGDGVDEDEDGFGWDVYGALPDRRVGVPDEPMMDQEIFGDEFCEHVARYCTQLEKFTIWRVLEASSTCHTIMTFTDRAMRALATLPVLRWVELKSVNITGDGLFALAACFAPQSESAKLQREFVITVGDEKGTATDMAFFECVERFLQLLVDCEPDQLPCARRSVALRLQNGRMNVGDRAWAKEYLARVSALAAAATAKHPSIRLRLLTRRYDLEAKTCDDIMELGFYTESTKINEWWGWENEPQDTRVDEFVICRGNLFNGGRAQARNFNDDDDVEDDDDDDEEYGDY